MNDMPPAVQAYTGNDLGVESKNHRALLSDLHNELFTKRVRLTDYAGSTPALLTPAMARWYAQFVNPKRRAALDAVDNLFGRVRADQDASGIFLERRLDEIEDRALIQKRAVHSRHREQHSGAYTQLSELLEEHNKAKRHFADIQAEKGGRPPRLIRWWYWVLLLVVGLAECLINYESFRSIKIMPSPAVALGSTIVIAILLTLASHLHGTIFKQARVYLGPHRDDIDRMHAVRVFGLGLTGLTVVMLAVWYARSSYLADVILEKTITGGEAPSWWSTVGGSLSLNFGVYIAGVIVAFLCHDEDPAYPDAYKAREITGRKYRALDENLSKPLRRSYEQINAQADIDKKNALGRDNALKHLESYQTARRAYEQIAAKDAEVLGILEAYRGELSREGPQSGFIVEIPSIFSKDGVETIDPIEYAGKTLTLKHI